MLFCLTKGSRSITATVSMHVGARPLVSRERRQGNKSNGSKNFSLEMERSMSNRGTAIGELAYPNDPWMTTASATGFHAFMLCEQYDHHQLKAHASKPRAKLLDQLNRLRAKNADAGAKLLAAVADPHSTRVNLMKVRDISFEIQDINQ